MLNKISVAICVVLTSALLSFSMLAKAPISVNGTGLKIGLLKYNGGGDWYSIVDALQNLVKFCNQNLNMSMNIDYATVDVGSADVFNYPFLFMTGHGNVVMSNQEMENLRTYMMAGGFIFIDDDYGMDPYVRPILNKILPEGEMKEIPFNHPIFHQKYDFPNGFPKVHEHDKKAPLTYGLFYQGRLVCVYATESNISDGWESPEVHNDTEAARVQSLRLGANIIKYAFTQ
ncbi:MAG: DUF4159 domain-containing protein [Saprospiraceae bacterium]|nr:DUF4159 domain-containing protein [Saprospiraceae bacterium]